MAEPVVGPGKEHGFIEPGGILKGHKFHGFPIPCMYCFAGYRPSNNPHHFSYMGVEIASPYIIKALQDSLVSLQGVAGEGKAQDIQLLSQHESFRVGRLLYRELGGRREKEGRGALLLAVPSAESKGLPHQGRPCEATGYTIKTAGLDQDPYTLEVDTVADPDQEIIKPGEWAVFGTLVKDELPPLSG